MPLSECGAVLEGAQALQDAPIWRPVPAKGHARCWPIGGSDERMRGWAGDAEGARAPRPVRRIGRVRLNQAETDRSRTLGSAPDPWDRIRRTDRTRTRSGVGRGAPPRGIPSAVPRKHLPTRFIERLGVHVVTIPHDIGQHHVPGRLSSNVLVDLGRCVQRQWPGIPDAGQPVGRCPRGSSLPPLSFVYSILYTILCAHVGTPTVPITS